MTFPILALGAQHLFFISIEIQLYLPLYVYISINFPTNIYYIPTDPYFILRLYSFSVLYNLDQKLGSDFAL